MDQLDRPREACGVAGMWSLKGSGVEVARNLFFALYALQHRGQEAAGICTWDGKRLHVKKGQGLVSQVFREKRIKKLKGRSGIAHNRYSTTGGNDLANVQPFYLNTNDGTIAVAHNGNLTNARTLRRALEVGWTSTSDTEVIAQALARPLDDEERAGAPDWPGRLERLLREAQGAYSIVVQTPEGIYALRDPHGFRPLCLGVLKEEGRPQAWIAASESCALSPIGAEMVREVLPGEIVRLDDEGITTVRAPQPGLFEQTALCIFEYVYFARPDSRVDGQSVHVTRQRMGWRLAEEAKVEGDDVVVIGVPDSSLVSAMAYAARAELPYTEGLIKNRYIGRTFIEPSQAMRQNKVRLKFNAVRDNLEGKRVVLVDDSIVRGTTMEQLITLVREQGGAREVHVRVAAPPIKHPCFMGVDLASHGELIAHEHDEDEIAAVVGADSLVYLSLEGLHAAVDEGAATAGGHCNACFSGKYPVDVRACLADEDQKHSLAGRALRIAEAV
ncbi:MAG: amidophosphoribosyltransferase [Alphaproteobacteria bacterium]|nr:amidophosphoribosyltransferase [Alphaproteobacteria bacterium]